MQGRFLIMLVPLLNNKRLTYEQDIQILRYCIHLYAMRITDN